MEEERRSFGKYISIIMRHQRIVLAKGLEQYGFSSGQHGFFIDIAHNEGINQRALAEKRNMTKGTANKAIKKLEEQGLVMTKIDEKDRRLHCVYLTDQGRKIVSEVKALLEDYSRQLTDGLDRETKLIVFEALQRMAENVKHMADLSRGEIDE